MEYKDIYGKYHTRFDISAPGIDVSYEVYLGSGLTANWGLVATGFFQAPGHGREAVLLVGERLQLLADTSRLSVLDLVEPDNGRSKAFFFKLAGEGIYRIASFGNQHYCIREFLPKIRG